LLCERRLGLFLIGTRAPARIDQLERGERFLLEPAVPGKETCSLELGVSADH